MRLPIFYIFYTANGTIYDHPRIEFTSNNLKWSYSECAPAKMCASKTKKKVGGRKTAKILVRSLKFAAVNHVWNYEVFFTASVLKREI